MAEIPSTRRAILATGVTGLLSGLAGCTDAVDPTQIAETRFSLTDGDFLRENVTRESRHGDTSARLITSRQTYDDLIDDEMWPEDADGEQFADTTFDEEFLVVVEVGLLADGNVEIGEMRVQADQVYYDVTINPTDGDRVDRLEYLVQRWAQNGGSSPMRAGANVSYE